MPSTNPADPGFTPSTFQQRLMALKDELYDNCCIVRGYRHRFRLRYKAERDAAGKRRDKTIPIPAGAEEDVDHLINFWRLERRRKREEDARLLLLAKLEAAEERLSDRHQVLAAGGGWRRRQRNRQILRDVRRSGPLAQVFYEWNPLHTRPNARPGPKRRARLDLPRTSQHYFGYEWKLGPFTMVAAALPPADGDDGRGEVKYWPPADEADGAVKAKYWPPTDGNDDKGGLKYSHVT